MAASSSCVGPESTTHVAAKSSILGLDSSCADKDLALYVAKLVGNNSPRCKDLKIDSGKSLAVCFDGGPKVFVSDKIMDMKMEDMKLALIGNFITFRPNVDQVRRWAGGNGSLREVLQLLQWPTTFSSSTLLIMKI